MKRYFHHIIIFASLFVILTSCQEEDLTTKGGVFNITLEDNPSSINKRSLPTDLSDELKNQFIINIENEEGQKEYNGSLDTYNTKSPAHKPGQYHIQASYGENKSLALDEPYYISEIQTETINANQATDVTLLCTVGNALATFIFANPAEAAEKFSNYTFVTKVNGTSVNCTAEDGHNPYFKEGSTVEFYIQGTTTDNKPFDYKFASISSAKKQMNYKYTISIGETTNGDATLDISVNTTIETVTINETVPEEWLPKAKITSEGFDGNNALNYRETTDAATTKINYQALKPIEDIEMTLNFEDPTLNSLNKTYIFSKITEEERQQLVNAGITLPELNNTTGSFELTNMISKLLCANDGTTAVNHISLRIKANNRWSDIKEYTINTLRPEFNITVNEGDFWSKEFAIREFNVTEGNAEKIKSNIVYQYSENGGTSWTNCNEGMKQKFSTHPENKNYKVRALYRGLLASNIADVTLETPAQLPNSDMEEWYIETKKKSGTWPFKDKTYYTFHPYLEGAAGSSWWDTNNDKAQGGTYALGIWYEGCFASCVSYTEDSHTGSKAALIYVSGCGDEYANTSNTYVGGAMVGSLFIGSYNSGIVQGHDFPSRPTSISFWYKYKPYNSDTFKVIVSLKDGENEIANGIYEPEAYSIEDNEYKQATINFNFINYEQKPTTICVQFLASNKTDLSQDDFILGTTISYPTIGNWTVHMGSILKIDDISLTFDK